MRNWLADCLQYGHRPLVQPGVPALSLSKGRTAVPAVPCHLRGAASEIRLY